MRKKKKGSNYYSTLSMKSRSSISVASFDVVSAVTVMASMHFYCSYRFISNVPEWSEEVSIERKRRVKHKEFLGRNGMIRMVVGRKPCRSL